MEFDKVMMILRRKDSKLTLLLPAVLPAGGHLEKASITGKRGIFRNVSPFQWILHLKIYKIPNFQKNNTKTLTPI